MNAFDSTRDRAQLLVAALAVAIAFALLPLASGLIGALVLYIAIHPVHVRLSAHVSARWSAIGLIVATTLLLFLPAAWLLSVTIDRAPQVFQQLYESAALARMAAIRVGDVDIGTRVLAAVDTVVAWISAQAFRLLGGAVRGTLNAVVAVFGAYFLLRASPDAWHRAAAYVPFSQASTALLAHRFRQVTEATLLGTALTAVLQGVVVALGFAAVGLPDAGFWGVVTAAVSVLPVLGSALVWLPGAVALIAQGRYGAGAALVALGAIVASNIDNVMRPLVNRRVSNLHPMTTIVGAFAGVGVFGLPGILLGPLAITYLGELAGLYRQEYGPGSAAEPTRA